MKRSVAVSVNEEKLSAIEMYLEQKNTTLAAKLNKYVDQLYQKNVPQNVRDFIELTVVRKSSRKACGTVTLPCSRRVPSCAIL